MYNILKLFVFYYVAMSHHPDESAALSRTIVIQLDNKIAFNKNNISIIDYLIDLDQLKAIPYNIIVSGLPNLQHIIKYVKDIPETTKKQFIGVYYTSEIEKQIAESLNPKIKCGYINDYKTIEEFAQSLSKNAVLWRSPTLFPKLHIVLQIWKQTDPVRLKELQISLYKNAINPFIYKIHIAVEGTATALDILHIIPPKYLCKIQFFFINGRLTYKNALEYISKLSSLDYAAIINTDIYFDESIRALWNVTLDNTFMALLRYDTTIEYTMGETDAKQPTLFSGDTCNCSQDAWIFQVKDVITDCSMNNWSNYDFSLGELGCDNTIISELVSNGWNVCNPCYTIKIYHLHDSNMRTYQYKNRITHGVYTFIAPSHILE